MNQNNGGRGGRGSHRRRPNNNRGRSGNRQRHECSPTSDFNNSHERRARRSDRFERGQMQQVELMRQGQSLTNLTTSLNQYQMGLAALMGQGQSLTASLNQHQMELAALMRQGQNLTASLNQYQMELAALMRQGQNLTTSLNQYHEEQAALMRGPQSLTPSLNTGPPVRTYRLQQQSDVGTQAVDEIRNAPQNEAGKEPQFHTYSELKAHTDTEYQGIRRQESHGGGSSSQRLQHSRDSRPWNLEAYGDPFFEAFLECQGEKPDVPKPELLGDIAQKLQERRQWPWNLEAYGDPFFEAFLDCQEDRPDAPRLYREVPMSF
ncbi:hypothetical protein F4825DRAFT_445997 [Nemania diffusa]|nr:hypothetical protein F4825DRAFT_445997 [Nemania diffusa]